MSSLDRSRLVVAIDGPSGSGKSSTSRGAARRLGMRYLDTGAIYRALTWWLLQQGVDVHDESDVVAHLDPVPTIVSGTDPEAPTITVEGTDVTTQIRTDEVTSAVSPVSAVPEVRALLLDLQRAQVGAGGIVVEGRDIGSVVCPDADLKVFLTADAEARASRRAAEMGGADVTATHESLMSRDRIDSGRTTAPLVMADGAVHLDGTALSLAEVIDQVVALVEAVEVRS